MKTYLSILVAISTMLIQGCTKNTEQSNSKQPEEAIRQVSTESLLKIGAKVYETNCLQCHLKDGQGLTGVMPPLANSDWLAGPPDQLIRTVYEGLEGQIEVNGFSYNGVMPAFDQLSNEEIAAVLTYTRKSFGNNFQKILPDQVREITGNEEVKIIGRKKKKKKYKNFEEGYLALDRISRPSGFQINVYAEVNDARSLHVSPNGTVFVSNSKYGNSIYALRDEDGDGMAEKKFLIAEGLARPNGLAFHNGDLYVSEIIRILKFPDIENTLENPPVPEIIYDQFPNQTRHAPKYIRFGPDGKLYVPVGADCNVCEGEYKVNATICRMNPDGSDFEIFAHGVRNSVGFDWHPETGEFWFTDNGRDLMGDDIPPCEINRTTLSGQHFGFPYFHGGDIPDPEFSGARQSNEFIAPEYRLQAHSAPLGLRFYTGDMFPESFKNAFFVCEHGSWNRSKKVGYRVMVGRINDNGSLDYKPFLEGWLDKELDDRWGRPVDVQPLEDGSLLISDDWANVVYRVTYDNEEV